MGKNKLVVYTCITGGYDKLREVRYISPSIDYICFSDNEKLTSKTWKILPLPKEVLSEKTDVKKQRLIKILPHKWFPEHDVSLWVDSNIEIIGDLTEFFNKYALDNKFLYVNKHPSRDCIYREQLSVIRLNKDTFENTSPQIDRYRDEGFPEHYGLAETNVLLRRHNDKKCVKLMEAWANEIRNGSHRDQLSFNYCVWKCDCKDRVEYLDEKYYNLHVSDNAFFCLQNHISIFKKEPIKEAVKKELPKEQPKKKEVSNEKPMPVSVVIFTHDRTNVARETMKSLFKNLKYSGKIDWVLADDRSTKEHLAELKAVFDEAGVKYELTQTTKTRFGLGASMNIGLKKAFEKSDVVLRVEDDWILERELVLDNFVKTLRDNSNVAGIRMGMVGGGVDYDASLFEDKNYKVMVGPDCSSWIFNNQVMIVHKRAHDLLGWYLENVSADKSEEEFRTRFNLKTSNGRKNILLLVPSEMKWRTFDDPSLWFIHVGRSTLGHVVYREPKRYGWLYAKRKVEEIKTQALQKSTEKKVIPAKVEKTNTVIKKPEVKKVEWKWPTISVMMTTHNRTRVACLCANALMQNLKYSGKIKWIICDDRSEPGHVEALKYQFKHNGVKNEDLIVCRTNSEHWGLGASMNNGLKEAFKIGDVVLTTEDDWYLHDKYDVSNMVKLLLDDRRLGGIRIGAMDPLFKKSMKLSRHSDYMKLEGLHTNEKWYIFNNQVMIRHKRVFDKIGLMKENCSADEQERDLCVKFNKATDYGIKDEYIVLWPKSYDMGTLYGPHNPFYHIGESTTKEKHRLIMPEFKDLNDLEMDKQIRRQNRTISILITTHNRTKLAKETLKSLVKNLKFSGRFHWIICDDRSKNGHIEELKNILIKNHIDKNDITLCKTNNEHFSLGASLNNGLRVAWNYGNVVLTTEDDWILQSKLDMDVFENTIIENQNVAGIRFATLLRSKSDLEDFSKNFYKITNKSGRKFIFNNQVMLRHKRIYDKLDYYKENTFDIQETEDLMSNKFNNLTNNGQLNNFVVLWPKKFPVNVMNNAKLPFVHAGISTVGHTHAVDIRYKKLN